MLAAPSAQAKSAALDGTLVANASKAGSKVEAPVLFSSQSAKKLKLNSPLATVVLKGSKAVPVPNPSGVGTVNVLPETLRSGDEIDGTGKLKGSAKKLMPKVKAGKLSVTNRESAYSVDELTAALVGLYNQVGALGLRVDALESGLTSLRAELEALKVKNSSLEGQINNLLATITDLEGALDDLTSLVNGLPTAAELQAILDDLDDLQNQIDALGLDVGALEGQIATLQGQVSGLLTDVGLICGSLPVC